MRRGPALSLDDPATDVRGRAGGVLRAPSAATRVGGDRRVRSRTVLPSPVHTAGRPASHSQHVTTPHVTPEDPPVNDSTDRDLTVAGVALRFGIVALTLGTAYIHSTLGGLLFTLNATGYAVFAIAMIVPITLAVRFRWLIRLGLMGYAAPAIFMWAIQGPYYTTAYIAKGIEVALIFLLAVDFLRADGNPVKVVKREVKAGLAKVGLGQPETAPAA